MQLLATFTGAQLNLIIAIAIIFAVLFVGNSVLLAVLFYRRKKRKLCTEALQQRREQLLEELAQLRYLKPKSKEDDESEEAEEAEDFDEIDESAADELDEDESDDDEGAEGEEEVRFADILAVRDMSALMRQRFGFEGSAFDRKCYYVRYAYSFEAKLRASSDETKTLYAQLMDEVARYPGLKVKRSFRQERIYAGRKTLAVLVFRGKTLCVAMALNPADYADTKYRGKDMAQIKRYAQTPMLIRVTSTRRMRYVKYLIAQLATLNGYQAEGAVKKGRYYLGNKTRKELFASNLMKIAILGEAPDLEGELPEADEDGADEVAASDAGRYRLSILAVRDMSDEMRRRLGFVGAEYDEKRYYVRYSYGFEAKLRSSSEEIKARYASFVDETGLYKKLTVACGFRQQRIYCGRRTVGLLFFKGKTLCVALALNPAVYENTKYRGIDVGEIKRFEKTPMLIKLTSERKLGYAKYLLNRLAEERGIALNATPVQLDYSVDELSFDELYNAYMLKIAVIGEVPSGVKE